MKQAALKAINQNKTFVFLHLKANVQKMIGAKSEN